MAGFSFQLAGWKAVAHPGIAGVHTRAGHPAQRARSARATFAATAAEN
ncbi:MAG: hypothetical protein R3F11_27985 [Verrucomicrobiales bacterium]